MDIKYVMMSTDNSELYKGFWELTSLFIKRINMIPVLFLITDKETDFINDKYGIVKNIKSINGVPTWFQSQVARLWGCQFFKEVCMTSDIDMFLLNEKYFRDTTINIPDNHYVNISADAYNDNRLPICYNIATGDTFKNVLNLDYNFSDFIKRLNNFKSIGWDTDEFYIGYMAKKHKDFIGKPRGFNNGQANLRLDRSNWKLNKQLINSYIDAHSLRPLNKYQPEMHELCKTYGILEHE